MRCSWAHFRRRACVAALALLVLAPAASAQEAKDDTILLTIFLRHDQSKPLDNITLFEMFFNDFRYVLGLDLAVPDAFGVDEDGDADGAKSDRAAICQYDLAHRISSLFLFALAETFGLKDSFKFGLHLSRTDL